MIADFTAARLGGGESAARAPRMRAHAPPSTPHGIASQGGVRSIST